MNKPKEALKIQTTISKQFDDILRRHAYTMRLNNNEVLELYQQAFLRELEREKAEKKAKKEAGKV